MSFPFPSPSSYLRKEKYSIYAEETETLYSDDDVLGLKRNSIDVSPKLGQPVSVRYTNLNRGETKMIVYKIWLGLKLT